MTTPLLEARDVRKQYGHVTALAGADFRLMSGECHALLGDNGAGKSTLVKILSGTLQPTSGEVVVNGVTTRFATPRDAQANGIETVYQDLAVSLTLDTPNNIFLGREPRRAGFLGKLGVLDRKKMMKETQELLRTLEVSLESMLHPVSSLSGGQRQGVAIARAIAWGAKILILDEPTAALGVAQKQSVLRLIKTLRSEHPELGVILITHDIPHVYEVATRATVLRHGRTVDAFDVQGTSEHELISAITGAAR